MRDTKGQVKKKRSKGEMASGLLREKKEVRLSKRLDLLGCPKKTLKIETGRMERGGSTKERKELLLA